MDISQITGTDPTSKSGQSSAKLSENFDTFLTLLTTQLQNQDPMDPMKADKFTQQLVQYSQVEQSIQTNQHLEDLLSATTADNFSNLVGYLGKTATMDTNVAGLKNGSAEWNYILKSDADEVKIVVKDDKGDVVHTAEGATGKGEHTFSWDGISDDGTEMPEGAYSVTVTAKTGDGSVNTTILNKGTVESVETVSGQHWLVLKGVNIPLGTLKKISEPASENPQGA